MPIRRPSENDPDWMAKKQDKELIYLEQRISALYEEASTELSKEYERFWENYQLEYDNRLAMVESGEITEDSFQRWCRNQIFQSNRYQAMIRMLTDVLVNADVAAMAAVNEQLPFTLAESYDFISSLGFEAADKAGISMGTFQIYNASSVQAIIRDNPDLLPVVDLPEDELWNRNHINNEITQAIIQGDSMQQVASRLQRVAHMDNNAAIRNARTSMTAAENLGRSESARRLKQKGLPVKEVWSATKDSRTRDSHLLLDGTEKDAQGYYGADFLRVPLRFPADPLGEPQEIYNCRCRDNVQIAGIDHSRDDELYENFMRENYPEDWQALQAREAESGKADERREALERQARLREEKNTKTNYTNEIISNLNFTGNSDAINQLSSMSSVERGVWEDGIENAHYTVREGTGHAEHREGYIDLYEDSSADTFFHETAHSMDDDAVHISFDYSQTYKGDEDRVPRTSTYGYDGSASGAAQIIYDLNQESYEIDSRGIMDFAGLSDLNSDDAYADDPLLHIHALRRALDAFGEQYGQDAMLCLSDMIDGHTEGRYPLMMFNGGHGWQFWQTDANHVTREAWANICELHAAGNQEAIDAIARIMPQRTQSIEIMYDIVYRGGVGYENSTITDKGSRILEEILHIRRRDSV